MILQLTLTIYKLLVMEVGNKMNKKCIMNIKTVVLITVLLSNLFIILPSEKVSAAYDGEDLALAILANSSWLIDSTYSDSDQYGNRQSTVLSSLGAMSPTNGPTFAFFSTGKAGVDRSHGRPRT